MSGWLSDPSLVRWLALAALFVLAMVTWGWWAAASRTRRGNTWRGKVARRAEAEAERLLVSRGYQVVDRQLHTTFDIAVDGQPVEVACRADLIVRRRRRHYVAEVKSGDAGDPTRPATRRQLLEYLLAFDVDGVLLVDMPRRAVVEVAFPLLRTRRA
ncbi:MAG: hypothetical protein H6733_00255 [Alphaproteobacteria bacterium]|nr:hypothetical protein [Alphaproteobacteria bacterium]